MLDRCLIDTNTLSYLLEMRDETVQLNARRHLNIYHKLYIPIVAYYEVIRGWAFLATAKQPNVRAVARRKIYQFEAFCHANEIVPLSIDACRYSAEIYATLKRAKRDQGKSNDILIAGIAKANSMVVVTENSADFADIPNLKTINWRDKQ